MLSQTSPLYTPDVWSEIDDLYLGGYRLAQNASRYLPQLTGESGPRYKDRLQCAGYLGYFGHIIDSFTSSVFAQDLVVAQAADASNRATPGTTSDTTFYSAFASNADLCGTPFASLEKSILRSALLKKRSLLAADFPTPAQVGVAGSRADEDVIGANRAYVFEIPVEQMIDWEYSSSGTYDFCVLYRKILKRSNVLTYRGGMITHEFKLWTVAGGLASWDTYRLDTPADKKIEPDTLFPRVDGNVTSFKNIPILEASVPDGLWAGNKVAGLAKEHWQRRTSLVSAEYKSLVCLPVAQLGPEISAMGQAMPSEISQNPNRGRDPISQFNTLGFMVIGSQDSVSFVEPTGAAYAGIREELGTLKDEMYRVVDQMAASVDNQASSMRRSGDSKAQDKSSSAVVLGALGDIARKHAKQVYTTISQARGENTIWTPKGLDDFQTVDRAGLLAEAIQIDTIAIPSKTFKKAHKTQVALQLTPNLPPETQDAIRAEIESGVNDEDALRVITNQAQKAAILNPPQPAAPGTPGASATPSPGATS